MSSFFSLVNSGSKGGRTFKKGRVNVEFPRDQRDNSGPSARFHSLEGCDEIRYSISQKGDTPEQICQQILLFYSFPLFSRQSSGPSAPLDNESAAGEVLPEDEESFIISTNREILGLSDPKLETGLT